MYVLRSFKSRNAIAINTLNNSLSLKYYKEFNNIFGSFTGLLLLHLTAPPSLLTFVTLDPAICDKAGMPNHELTWFDILVYSKFHSEWFQKGKLVFAKFFFFFLKGPHLLIQY